MKPLSSFFAGLTQVEGRIRCYTCVYDKRLLGILDTVGLPEDKDCKSTDITPDTVPTKNGFKKCWITVVSQNGE